jgi:chaperonin GroEL
MENTEKTLIDVYKKMFHAKKYIAETKVKKAGKNEFSKYDYFTPEQIAQLVYDACSKPFFQILANAGYSESDASMIAMIDLKGCKDFWAGYNIKECSTVNMKQAGIIDPFKVTKQALLNASSIAGTILLTEVAIVDIPEEKQSSSQMDPSMMGMM